MPDPITGKPTIREAIKPADLATLDRMADRGHMRPVIECGDCWECETTNGEGFVVPSDLVSIPNHDRYDNGQTIDADDDNPAPDSLRKLAALADYMGEGCSGDSVQSAIVRRGVYLCRMSAPGYMDCTDWEAHDSAQAAASSLIENYDNADDEGDGTDEDKA
jgi:hypothetical protein